MPRTILIGDGISYVLPRESNPQFLRKIAAQETKGLIRSDCNLEVSQCEREGNIFIIKALSCPEISCRCAACALSGL